MLTPVLTALVFWSTCLGPLKILPFPGLASEQISGIKINNVLKLEYLKCWFVSTFAHPPISEELMKLLDAKRENNGPLGFKVIMGHPWCLDVQAKLWNWLKVGLQTVDTMCEV